MAKKKQKVVLTEIVQARDCVEFVRGLDDAIPLACVDPPFNVSFDYGEEYNDARPSHEYLSWCNIWLKEITEILSPTGALWIAIGDKYVSEIDCLAKSLMLFKRAHVIWTYTFGVNCTKTFTKSHTHLLYFTKHKSKFVFNQDAIRVPSARATTYNDKRANPAGRLPDDTWILRPQAVPAGFAAESDTWHIPRIAGTFKQRQSGAANQMPEQLLGRIIRACSNPGDTVLDTFGGTGTTAAVAKKLGRGYATCDISEKFVRRINMRLAGIHVGDPLDGPIPQGG